MRWTGRLGWIGLLTSLAPAASAGPAAAMPADRQSATAYWVFLVDRGEGGSADVSLDRAATAPPSGSAAARLRAYAAAPLETRAGLGAEDLTDAELLAVARELPPEAWARRMRSGGAALPDIHDLPLWEPYVREVARHGELRCRSRWLNAVSLALTPEAQACVADLPCVAALRPVASAAAASLGPARDPEGRALETLLRVERRPAPRERLNAPTWLDAITYGPSLGQLSEIDVPALHRQGYSGSGVRLMMIDTGFYKEHDALRGADILAEWDFVFGDGETQNEPEDWPWQHHHGTGAWSVAGGFAPGRLIGPAYGATFLLAKTENPLSETRLEEDYYVAALEWGDSLGVDVTSASLNYLCFDGGFCYTSEERDGDTAVITVAVDLAAARGILCVNSLGNYGCTARTTLGTPADADSMLACGAVDSLNGITSFSACGPTSDGRTKPEVVARGLYTYMAGAGVPDAYGPGSGTSFSTPLVAGAAALLMEVHPEWSAMRVREALLATADRAAAPDDRYGWGRISAAAAAEWGPVVHPRPFSLLSPPDGAAAAGEGAEFRWQASAQAGASEAVSGPLAYTIEIVSLSEEADASAPRSPDFARGSGWSASAGADTTLALGFELPAGDYGWRVVAENAAGHRRASREVHHLRLSGEAAGALPPAPIPPAPVGAALRVALSANPFRGALGLRIRSESAAAGGSIPTWSIYDPLGRRIASGAARPSGGDFEAAWNGTGPGSLVAGRGVYYLEVVHGQSVTRDVLVRLGE